MDHPFVQENSPQILVERSRASVAETIARLAISSELAVQISTADILIIPTFGHVDSQSPLFPEGTEALLDYLRQNSPSGIAVDICIDDDDYKELALHFALYDLGIFFVSLVAAPACATLIANYIQK